MVHTLAFYLYFVLNRRYDLQSICTHYPPPLGGARTREINLRVLAMFSFFCHPFLYLYMCLGRWRVHVTLVASTVCVCFHI